MADYGMVVWDQVGALGTIYSDILAIGHFADFITYTAPPPGTTDYNSVVIDGVPAGRSIIVMYRFEFNGRYIPVVVGAVGSTSQAWYNATTEQLTLRNQISSQPSTFFLAMTW